MTTGGRGVRQGRNGGAAEAHASAASTLDILVGGPGAGAGAQPAARFPAR